MCHKILGANQQVSVRDVKKMRIDLAVLSNNTWRGYCGGHGRTANQITHSPVDKMEGVMMRKFMLMTMMMLVKKMKELKPPIVVHKRLKFALFGLLIVNTKPHQ